MEKTKEMIHQIIVEHSGIIKGYSVTCDDFGGLAVVSKLAHSSMNYISTLNVVGIDCCNYFHFIKCKLAALYCFVVPCKTVVQN